MQAHGLFQGTVSGPAGLQNAPATTLITPDNQLMTVFSSTDPRAPLTGLITGTGTVVASGADTVTLDVPATQMAGDATCTGSVAVTVARDPATGGVSVSASSSAAGSSSAGSSGAGGLSVSSSSSASGSSSAGSDGGNSSSSSSSGSSSGSCTFSSSISASTPDAGTTPFDFAAPASLPDVVGTWMGDLTDQGRATLSVAADGTVTGSGGSCTFTGRMTPNAAYNYFTVQMTFGPGCHQLAGVTASGFAVAPSGGTLLAALVDASSTHGAVFVGARSPAS